MITLSDITASRGSARPPAVETYSHGAWQLNVFNIKSSRIPTNITKRPESRTQLKRNKTLFGDKRFRRNTMNGVQLPQGKFQPNLPMAYHSY